MYEPNEFELTIYKRAKAERVAEGYRWVCPECGEVIRVGVEPRAGQSFIFQCTAAECGLRHIVHAKEGKVEN